MEHVKQMVMARWIHRDAAPKGDGVHHVVLDSEIVYLVKKAEKGQGLEIALNDGCCTYQYF